MRKLTAFLFLDTAEKPCYYKPYERMIFMKKIFALILIATMIFVFTACNNKKAENVEIPEQEISEQEEIPAEITETYTDEEGNVKEFTYVTKETSDKFVLFEEALLEKGISFEVETKAEGIIDGAIEGRKYSFETGKVFEIFKFDVKSEAYKEAAKTSKMYMEMFDVYIQVAVNSEYALIPANDEEIKALFLSLE